MSPVTIDRLDYSKPPRRYLERQSDPQEEAALFADPAYEACYLGMTRGESLLAAWTHYKTHNDPPGLVVGHDEDGHKFYAVGTHNGGRRESAHEARAAAWVWYDRRLKVAGEVECDPRYRIDHCDSCRAENPPQTDDRCPACGEDGVLISTWGGGQAQRYRSGERYSTPEGEEDQDEGSSMWPRCLTWPDEQVAEVERWLVDSTAEMPEVLRG